MSAQTVTAYNSIPKPLPGNVASEGPEAYAFAELGDALQLASSGGTLGQVSIVMSSWGCQQGNWFSGNCVTANGATFSQPITVNIYGVSPNLTVGPLLGSIMQTFNVPYRPSSTPNLCNGDAARWYNSKDKTCYHGIAAQIVVNFSTLHIPVPANNQIIVTVSYNTSHYGPQPIGESAVCFATSAGCPYDSLNISTDTTDGTFSFVGAPLDPNGIFFNYYNAANSCNPNTQPTGVLMLDTAPGCWLGFHPEFQVQVNTNGSKAGKGSPQ